MVINLSSYKPCWVNCIVFIHFSQDASVLDQIEEDILAEFQTMRMPAPKVSKISDLIPVLNLPIPPHLINTVSNTYLPCVWKKPENLYTFQMAAE